MSTITPHHLKAAMCVVAALWSIVMVAWLFTRRGRNLPHWFIWAWVLLSASILAWGILGFSLDFQKASLSAATYRVIGWAKTMVSGLAAGIFITLVMSGELFKAPANSGGTPGPVA